MARHATQIPNIGTSVGRRMWAPKYWHVIVSRLLLVGPPRRETVDLFVSCDTHNPVSHDAIPFNHSDTSSLYLIPIYSRLRRHPDRGWLCSLTRDQQYRRAVHAAHHSHLLGTNLWVQMPTPLQTRGEGRLAILRRASTRTLAGQTTLIPTTCCRFIGRAQSRYCRDRPYAQYID